MEIEHRLTAVEERAKSNTRRIEESVKRQDNLEKRQDNLEKLASNVEVLALRELNVENDVKEIKSDVKMLTEKPAQRWDSMVDKVIWAVLAAVIGFVLAKIGL